MNFISRSFHPFLLHSHPADFPDTVFARHGESSAAVRPAGSREIRVAYGELVRRWPQAGDDDDSAQKDIISDCIFTVLGLIYDTSLFGGRGCAQIEDGEIYASINQKDGMVCFHDNPEKYNNPAMLHKIDQEVRRSGFSVLMSIY